MPTLPLANIRILDLTWWVAGPTATTQMAMMGAEVIRLESVRRSDSMRATTPFANGQQGINRSGRWNSHNYSKLSAALDLGKPEGAELARRLVAKSDVVFENFSAGVLERMGLGYEVLKEINPGIVLCSVSFLGRDGPRRHYIGFGPTAIAYSGLASITGYPGGLPGTVPPFIADYVGGWHATLSVVAALHGRERTGLGKRIDMSMVEAQVSQFPEAFIDATLNGRVPQAKGNDHPTAAPHGYYPCLGEDRWLAISVATDAQWQALCGVMEDVSRLVSDPRFCDAMARHQHTHDLDGLLSAWTRQHDAFALESRLQAAGVPAGVALTSRDVYANPHLQARGAFISPPHREVGPYPMVGLPWKLSDVTPVVGPSPLLGQDNQYVYGQLLGLSKEEIERLEKEGVIA
ncbi:MAG: CoA transferase [Chloroflexota bacterium]